MRFPDYREVDVFSAFRKLDIDGVDWYLMSEIDVAEALILSDIQNILMLCLGGSVFLILLGAWFFSSTLARRLLSITSAIKNISVTNMRLHSCSLRRFARDCQDSTGTSFCCSRDGNKHLTKSKRWCQKLAESAKESEEKTEESKKMANEGRKAVSEIFEAMKEIKDSNMAIEKASAESNERVSGINDLIVGNCRKNKSY